VLVVDDDPDARDGLRDLLVDAGFDVATASDGAAALAILRAAPALPRVILLDLEMPRMDGWAFCASRRQEPALAAIPVVLISGHAGPTRAAPYAGVVAVLAKPVDPDTLLAVVARLAPGGRGDADRRRSA
jgi:CheY-like chemotaxis protein